MDTSADRVIGAQLKQLRKRKELTQKEVASRLCVTQPMISKIESGERSLRFHEVFSFASAMDISPEHLYLYIRTALKEDEDTSDLVH
jgi:transcriptional regulator with XRE-family HTH domain